MGELRLPGLATGIDTAALIKQLMAINSRRLANYQIQKIEYEARTTLLSELRGKVKSFDLAIGAISDSDDLEAFNASSSNTNVLTISATEDAGEGSHSVLINQLATSETWIQDTSTFDYETDYVGEGTFIYTYNYQQITITTTDTTKLEDMVTLINKDGNNPGVSASLLYQGGKYHLMLSSKQTGEDYQISIDSEYREVWQADSAFTVDTVNAALTTKITELDKFGDLPLEGGETITISGITHNGSAITSLDLSLNSDTTLAYLIDKINEAFTGVAKATLKDGKIVLTDLAENTSSLSISLQYNKNESSADLILPTMAVSTEGGGSLTTPTSLDPNTFIPTQAAQNAELRIDEYIPALVAEEQRLTPATLPTSGTFTLTFEGQTTAAIDFDADVTVGVDSIRAKLEALSNVEPGDIVVSGTQLSATGATIFTFLNTAGDVGMISIDPAGLDQSDISNYTMAETIEGENSQWVTSNSNVVTDVLTGVTLTLKDVNELNDSEEPILVNITVTRNINGVKSKISGMVSAYNNLVTYLREKSMYNADTKKLGELSNEMMVSLLKTQIRNPFSGELDGFTEDDVLTQASDIGITMDGHGLLKIDNTVLDSALSDNFNHVLELVCGNVTGETITGTEIAFHAGSAKYTTAGNYEVDVTVTDTGGGDMAITAAQIRYQDPNTSQWSLWRDAEFTGNVGDAVITGNSTTDSTGKPLYPENNLQFNVVLTAAGDFSGTLRVKKGFTSELSIMLEDTLEETGRLDILEDINTEKIDSMENRIAYEEARLENIQDRLILKYARLEKTLTLLQLQMGAVSAFVSGYNI